MFLQPVVEPGWQRPVALVPVGSGGVLGFCSRLSNPVGNVLLRWFSWDVGAPRCVGEPCSQGRSQRSLADRFAIRVPMRVVEIVVTLAGLPHLR